MASNGLRTLALAYRDFPAGEDINWEEEAKVVSNLNFVAIVGIEDPVRAEVGTQSLPFDWSCAMLLGNAVWQGPYIGCHQSTM